MNAPLVRAFGLPRWTVVIAAFLFLAGVAEAGISQASHPPRLGVSASPADGRFTIDWVEPASAAWDAGVQPGAIVVQVDGAAVSAATTLDTVATAQSIVARDTRGAEIRAATSHEVAAEAVEMRRLGFLVLAVVSLVTAGIVFALANGRAEALAFFAASFSLALLLVAGLITPFGSTWAFLLEYGALLCFGSSTLWLFLVFPVKWLCHRVPRVILISCASMSGLVLLAHAVSSSVHIQAYGLLQPAAFLLVGAELMGSVVMVALAFVHRPADARHSRWLIALGLGAAIAPFSMLSLLPHALGLGYVVAPDLSILFAVLFPIAIGAAVLTRSFPGIERFVCRGLIAWTLWVVLLAFYTLVFETARALVFERAGISAPDYGASFVLMDWR
jgi:hypothetical protein